ncbi:MAG: IS3 family transposase [Planctomycetes bacterium]|nr:IS3 family transposase [Planctomycetota bacterium]
MLNAYEASGQGMRAFCEEQGLSTATLCSWRRRLASERLPGLERRPNPRHSGKPGRKPYPPEERRKAVEAFAKSGMTAVDFARLWGISTKALVKWRRRYEEGGPKALESVYGRRKGSAGGAAKRLPAPLRAEITKVLRRFPFYGLRRVRDWLRRFGGVAVSAGAVRRVREEEAIPPPAPPRRRRRRRPAVRRFERSRPRELWQSDITSILLPRHGQRAYLVVFLDDFSRYVVGWTLASQQRGEMVIEALLGAITRFGKPREVLTDQGRQYYSWRGKSDFQKVLLREGIAHVVSRAHHPETLGKCERLWETLNAELWDRAHPQDLEEARERLSHWFAHYNHFRPHQGIDGMVPADRFFGAEDLVRKAIEQRISENELLLAVGEKPRTGVYLVGQVGERQVSVHGEKGRVVIRTEEGAEEIEADSLGAPEAREEEGDGEHGDEGGDGAADAALPEAAIQEGAEDAGAGEGALGAGERGGAEEGARDVRAAARALAREGDEGGGGVAAEGAAAQSVATVAAGAGGDGGGVPPAAEGAGDPCGAGTGGADGPQEEASAARAGGGGEGLADRAPQGDAGAPRDAAGDGGGGGEPACARQEEEGSEGSGPGSTSRGSSGRGE